MDKRSWLQLLFVSFTFFNKLHCAVKLTCDPNDITICQIENLSTNLYWLGDKFNFNRLNATALATATDVSIVNSTILRLPKNILSALPNVRRLTAEHCGLTEIGLTLFGSAAITNSSVDTLQVLNLDENHFPTLTSGLFAGATNLLELHLVQCEISLIENYAFYGLRNLKTLRLDYNLISSLQTIVWEPLISLKALFLGGNLLTQVDLSVFQNNQLLSELDLGFNRISGITSNYNIDISVLGLMNNSLWDIKGLQKLEKLEVLVLSFNPYLTLQEGSFDSFADSLKILYLVEVNLKNKQTSYERLFGKLQKLQVLDIGKNALKDLDLNEFPILQDLKSFHIYENNLSNIKGLELLKTNFAALQQSDISQNSWDCKYLNKLLQIFEGAGVDIDFVQGHPENARDGKVIGALNNLKGVGCTDFLSFIVSEYEYLKSVVSQSLKNITELSNLMVVKENEVITLKDKIQADHLNVSAVFTSQNNKLAIMVEERNDEIKVLKAQLKSEKVINVTCLEKKEKDTILIDNKSPAESLVWGNCWIFTIILLILLIALLVYICFKAFQLPKNTPEEIDIGL